MEIWARVWSFGFAEGISKERQAAVLGIRDSLRNLDLSTCEVTVIFQVSTRLDVVSPCCHASPSVFCTRQYHRSLRKNNSGEEDAWEDGIPEHQIRVLRAADA